MYILFLFVIAFRDEELAYPWTYAAILALSGALMAKFFGHSPTAIAVEGVVTFLYVGCVFQWLSRLSRFSIFWWVALFLAALPAIPQYLLKGLHHH